MSKDKGTKNTKKTPAIKSENSKKQSAYKSESSNSKSKITPIEITPKKPNK